MSKNDMETVTVTCCECGAGYQVKHGTYRKKPKDGKWRCVPCNVKYRKFLFDSMSEEDRQAYLDRKNKAISEGWARQSVEAKKAVTEQRKSMWAGRSEEEKNTVLHGARSTWKTQSEETRNERLERMFNGRREYWKNVLNQKDGSKDLSESKPNTSYTVLNRNDNEFIEILNIIEIPFTRQYPNMTKHPDFDTLFPINPITQRTIMDPFHSWDFMIETKAGKILVDVDGSMHKPPVSQPVSGKTAGKARLVDYVQFKDSQRPYQTDGLEAYIVMAYNDRISGITDVKSVQTNEIISLDDFIQKLVSIGSKNDTV